VLPYSSTSMPRLRYTSTEEKDSPTPLVLPVFMALRQTEEMAVKACQISYPELVSGPVTEKMRIWQRLSPITLSHQRILDTERLPQREVLREATMYGNGISTPKDSFCFPAGISSTNSLQDFHAGKCPRHCTGLL